MRTALRRMGNSSGFILPKPLLLEVGLRPGDSMDVLVEDGRIVLAPVKHAPREGWAEASRALATAGDDEAAWPEFGNAEDAALQW